MSFAFKITLICLYCLSNYLNSFAILSYKAKVSMMITRTKRMNGKKKLGKSFEKRSSEKEMREEKANEG